MKLPTLWRKAAPRGGAVPIDATGVGSGMTLNLNRVSSEMLREYTRSIYLWRCVDMIAQMASSVELEVKPTDNRGLNPAEQQVQDLLAKPNPQWNYAALQYFVAASLAVANRCYLLRIRGMNGETLELWPINANEITTVYRGMTKVIDAFQWIGPGNQTRQIVFPVDPDTGDCDILYVQRPALNWVADQSPAAVAAAPAEVFTRILQRCADIVNNTSNITGVLSTDAELGQKAITDMKDRLNQYKTGGAESGSTLITASARWDMTRLSEDPSSALSVEIKDSLARDVCMTFGVPSQLVGLPGTDTYNNIALARVGFMTDCVLPGYVNLYVAALNAALMDDVDASICPDIDGLPAMRTSRLQLVDTANKATMLSINEQRELLGYAPYDDPDADTPVELETLRLKRLQIEMQFGAPPMDTGQPT
jgi:HK97 family phage portal protein